MWPQWQHYEKKLVGVERRCSLSGLFVLQRNFIQGILRAVKNALCCDLCAPNSYDNYGKLVWIVRIIIFSTDSLAGTCRGCCFSDKKKIVKWQPLSCSTSSKIGKCKQICIKHSQQQFFSKTFDTRLNVDVPKKVLRLLWKKKL